MADVGHEEMRRRAGLSYRQLDHWTTRQYLRATGGGTAGVPRRWAESEVLAAREAKRLVDAGLTVEAAFRIVRGVVEIAPGVLVVRVGSTGPAAMTDGAAFLTQYRDAVLREGSPDPDGLWDRAGSAER